MAQENAEFAGFDVGTKVKKSVGERGKDRKYRRYVFGVVTAINRTKKTKDGKDGKRDGTCQVRWDSHHARPRQNPGGGPCFTTERMVSLRPQPPKAEEVAATANQA